MRREANQPNRVEETAEALVAVYHDLALLLPLLEGDLRAENEEGRIEERLAHAEKLMACAGPLAATLRQAGASGRDAWLPEARGLAEQVLSRLARAQEEAHRRVLNLQAERSSVNALRESETETESEEKCTLVEV